MHTHLGLLLVVGPRCKMKQKDNAMSSAVTATLNELYRPQSKTMQYLCEGERYVSGVPGTEVEAEEPGGTQLRVWTASWEVAEA